MLFSDQPLGARRERHRIERRRRHDLGLVYVFIAAIEAQQYPDARGRRGDSATAERRCRAS
jgi:hypothetical protein